MGGIASVASTAIKALGTVNTVLGAVNTYKKSSGKEEYNQTKALNDLRLQQERERAALEKEQLQLSKEQAESQRQSALRRAVARQKALFGSGGTGSSDGSAKAVLLGLFDESDEERAQREALDTLKTKAIDTGVAQTQRLNTLQLSQLKERNRINQFTAAYDGLSTISKL